MNRRCQVGSQTSTRARKERLGILAPLAESGANVGACPAQPWEEYPFADLIWTGLSAQPSRCEIRK
jgi:hypothetical protein